MYSHLLQDIIHTMDLLPPEMQQDDDLLGRHSTLIKVELYGNFGGGCAELTLLCAREQADTFAKAVATKP